MNRDAPLVLGIETSCDETGVGIVRGSELLANVIASSMDEHARYGGVVPEVAARAHLEALGPTIDAALAEADVDIADVEAVAVTSGPGLAGALMVGVGAAKALALALDRPIYAVNHLVGHVGADILDDEAPLETPTVALLVSGGHTSLLLTRMAPDDPMRQSLIEMERSAERAAEIASDLAAFSRQEKEPKSHSAGNLNLIVRQTSELFQNRDAGLVQVWNGETGIAVEAFTGHQGAVRSVVFGADGRVLAGAADKTAVVWDADPEWQLAGQLGPPAENPN